MVDITIAQSIVTFMTGNVTGECGRNLECSCDAAKYFQLGVSSILLLHMKRFSLKNMSSIPLYLKK